MDLKYLFTYDPEEDPWRGESLERISNKIEQLKAETKAKVTHGTAETKARLLNKELEASVLNCLR
jgi:hypothetical protein